MRYIALANNWVGLEVVRWLVANGYPPTAMVVHPDQRAKYRQEILGASGVPMEHVFEGPDLRDPTRLEAIGSLGLELGVSLFFDYLLKPEFLRLLPSGCLNLHPALLPFNRGQYPNVWSIVERTPAGVTLHYVDEGIDTGDIVAQREVAVSMADTGESLYRRLERACVEMFADTWPLVVSGAAPRRPQEPSAGTSHRTRDVETIDEIDLDRSYPARYLIDVLRARTFPPYRGAYFWDGARRVYLRLALELEN